MMALWFTWALAAQCSGPACPDPCTACAFQPVNGQDPAPDEYQSLLRDIAERNGAADLPSIANIETGADRASAPSPFPCRLLPAIASVESSMTQFCGGDGPTVISFDCGFGVMQVTSGASNYPGLEARADVNIAAGANILASKWNGDDVYGGRFGDSDPSIVESWYFAVWAYNGFVYGNNPNNPDFPASRPPYSGPGSLSRGSYPYQELVWGALRNPLTKDGVVMWEALEVSYPDPTTIPDQSGLFSVDVPLPEPSHADPCVVDCPPQGCPPEDQRELIVDDADASFALVGDATTHEEGGFRDQFRSAAPSDGAASVTATWSGVAPWSGIFSFGAFIPLDPATNESMRITVEGHGGVWSFTQNQNVPGGFFQSLGRVELRAGDTVRVVVTNASSDTDPSHRLGLDAFRFAWSGDGATPEGSACADTLDCAGELVCTSDVCAPAPPQGEGEGEGGEGEGEGEGAGEGEGEGEDDGEGEDGGDGRSVKTDQGCSCASIERAVCAGVLALMLRRRRRAA